MAESGEVSWQTLLAEAQACAAQNKFFDGVQKINPCMEAFEKVVSDEPTGEILKDPVAFSAKVLPKLTEEQKTALGSMHEVRGNLLLGLGANKRALLEFSCAENLGNAGAKSRKGAAEAAMSQGTGKVSCSILTGFLGSGKTTLLNNILRTMHGKRIAVIENEFGEVGIDDDLVARSMETEENIVEMNNGCICCTVRGDLIAGLKKLVKKAAVENKPLDGILIETTGLADPAPVAQTFFADDYVQQKCTLDGILTLVDAKHIIQHLDEEKPEGVENEAVEQLAFADRILLNKVDLVDEDTLKEVERRIRAINATVPIKRCTQSVVDMDFILGVQAFSLDKVLDMDGGFLAEDAEHSHDESVSSVGIDTPGEVDKEKLDNWIGWLMREKGTDLFRYKGVLAVKGSNEPFVFQGIHMLFSGSPQSSKPFKPEDERRCKFVFIGKNLNREELVGGFMKCMVS